MPVPYGWMLATIAALRARGQSEVQTRDSLGELKTFKDLEGAAAYALINQDVWKISYSERDGKRRRFVRCGCECNYFYEEALDKIILDQIANLENG